MTNLYLPEKSSKFNFNNKYLIRLTSSCLPTKCLKFLLAPLLTVKAEPITTPATVK